MIVPSPAVREGVSWPSGKRAAARGINTIEVVGPEMVADAPCPRQRTGISRKENWVKVVMRLAGR